MYPLMRFDCICLPIMGLQNVAFFGQIILSIKYQMHIAICSLSIITYVFAVYHTVYYHTRLQYLQIEFYKSVLHCFLLHF